MSVVFAVEPLENFWNGLIALAAGHWKETMQWQHGRQEFAPEFERYNEYQKCNWLLAMTARDNGRLVGYAIMYITPSMHTQQRNATEDAIYLLPEYRKGRNALRFFQFVEDECCKRGARQISATAQPGSPAGRILEHMGFTVINHQYSKHLEETA